MLIDIFAMSEASNTTTATGDSSTIGITASVRFWSYLFSNIASLLCTLPRSKLPITESCRIRSDSHAIPVGFGLDSTRSSIDPSKSWRSETDRNLSWIRQKTDRKILFCCRFFVGFRINSDRFPSAGIPTQVDRILSVWKPSDSIRWLIFDLGLF